MTNDIVQQPAGALAQVSVTYSASELARLICGERGAGSEDAQRFGEIFHERYSEHMYHHHYSNCTGTAGFGVFRRRLAAACGAAGLDRDWIAYGVRLAAALLKAGVEGLTPKTANRQLDNVEIFAKPDLAGWGFYEFKTYPADEFCRIQAAIFAWVVGQPVTLAYPTKKFADFVEVATERIGPIDPAKIREVLHG